MWQYFKQYYNTTVKLNESNSLLMPDILKRDFNIVRLQVENANQSIFLRGLF